MTPKGKVTQWRLPFLPWPKKTSLKHFELCSCPNNEQPWHIYYDEMDQNIVNNAKTGAPQSVVRTAVDREDGSQKSPTQLGLPWLVCGETQAWGREKDISVSSGAAWTESSMSYKHWDLCPHLVMSNRYMEGHVCFIVITQDKFTITSSLMSPFSLMHWRNYTTGHLEDWKEWPLLSPFGCIC